ncbi:hypothetical protein [Nocardia veterana]|uniref:Uncharacterized protein n=1 Tax=Nocardia veterana TaxID=132249 RepID=A0A7X6LW63_9NOCA|nr:hypothetical protein [Nocardia veterana]NKY85607.1 hypothetical protein [Nocardia veterana]
MALALLVAPVAGCASRPSSGPKADDRDLTTNRDLSGACGANRTYFPKAPAYAGSAPHPIVAFVTSDLGSIDEVSTTEWDSDRPLQWSRVEPARYQLIACLGKGEAGEYLTTCTFDDGETVPLHRGRYEVTVYEAATGKKVGSEQLRGSAGDHNPCPFLTYVRRDNPKLYTEPGYDEFRTVLGKYVDRAVAAAPGSTTGAGKPGLVSDISGLCDALAADIPETAEQLPLNRTGSGGNSQQCTWGSDSYDRNNPAPPPRLRVSVTAHGGVGSTGSAVEAAQREYESDRQFLAKDGAPQPVPGLGDQAALANRDADLVVAGGPHAGRYPGRETKIIVLARNVTIEITWGGPAAQFPTERTEPEATELARRIIARLPG